MAIIQWCNENAGFWSAILALSSISVTIVTALLAYKVGNLPYQKKIRGFLSISHVDTGGYLIRVEVINLGPATAYIYALSVSPVIKNKRRITPSDACLLHSTLEMQLAPGERYSTEGIVLDRDNVLEKCTIDPNGKLKIDVFEYDSHHVIKSGFPVG